MGRQAGSLSVERYRRGGALDAKGKQPLRVWDRVDGELVERAAVSTALFECVALHLWWVVLPSEYGPMLRLARNPEGESCWRPRTRIACALADEVAGARRARSLAEHERMLAQHAQAVAERARAEAEAENKHLRAELARLRGGT